MASGGQWTKIGQRGQQQVLVWWAAGSGLSWQESATVFQTTCSSELAWSHYVDQLMWQEFNVWQSQVLEVDRGQTTLPVVSTPGPSCPKLVDVEHFKHLVWSRVLTYPYFSVGEGLQGQQASYH
jgi:hypothetical protein